MNTHDFLKHQFRLLVLQFGRRTVLDAFAAASEASSEQLQDEISKLEAMKKAKATKLPKSLEDILSGVHGLSGDHLRAITSLARLYEAKQFLPNLRDAEEFVRRTGGAPRKHKSRKEAMAAVVKALASIPQSESEALLADATRSPGQSDYAILAKQIMGRPH
jgi:hypothetical protein